MHRSLIVANLATDDPEQIATLFERSDETELPHLIGVTRRTLFRFHGLYFHSVEANEDIAPHLYRARSHPLYQELSERLAQLVSPYDPNWKEPKDAMAAPFYVWTDKEGRLR